MRFERATVIWCLVGALGCSRTGLRVPDAGLEGGDEPSLCIELPLDGRGAVVDLATDARLHRADVFFLLDTSGSMQAEIGEIRSTLRDRLAPLIGETFPDVQYGVGMFADFPFPIRGYGGLLDRPFELGLQMTSDLGAVQAALDRVGESQGLDQPESQVEALYQIATGEGLGPFVQPSLGCPSGGFGAPCFRKDAGPVILLFTDAPFHNGPRNLLQDRYLPGVIRPEPHLYGDALDALMRHRIRVIGLWSGEADDPDREDLELVARDTGAIDERGDPIIFDIGTNGDHLGNGVVTSLGDFAAAAVFDVSVVAVDPDPLDGVDVRGFVAEVRPVRTIPDTAEGFDLEHGRILGVQAGTTVVFEVVLRADAAVPRDTPQRFALRLEFRGDDTVFLGDREVEVVIPSTTGEGCDREAAAPTRDAQ